MDVTTWVVINGFWVYIASDLFPKLWYQKKTQIVLIGDFYRGKIHHFEDINENMTSYGNHN